MRKLKENLIVKLDDALRRGEGGGGGGPPYDSLYVACSAGVFFERAICSRKRHVETSRREEEKGRVTTVNYNPNLPLS